MEPNRPRRAIFNKESNKKNSCFGSPDFYRKLESNLSILENLLKTKGKLKTHVFYERKRAKGLKNRVFHEPKRAKALKNRVFHEPKRAKGLKNLVFHEQKQAKGLKNYRKSMKI